MGIDFASRRGSLFGAELRRSDLGLRLLCVGIRKRIANPTTAFIVKRAHAVTIVLRCRRVHIFSGGVRQALILVLSHAAQRASFPAMAATVRSVEYFMAAI
jgi:hypothetical protein